MCTHARMCVCKYIKFLETEEKEIERGKLKVDEIKWSTPINNETAFRN